MGLLGEAVSGRACSLVSRHFPRRRHAVLQRRGAVNTHLIQAREHDSGFGRAGKTFAAGLGAPCFCALTTADDAHSCLCKVVDLDLPELMPKDLPERVEVLEEFLREVRKLRTAFRAAGSDAKTFRGRVLSKNSNEANSCGFWIIVAQ